MVSGTAAPLKQGIAGYFGGREPHPELGNIVATIQGFRQQAAEMAQPSSPQSIQRQVPQDVRGMPEHLGGPAVGAPPPDLPIQGPLGRGGRLLPSPMDLAVQDAEMKTALLQREITRVFTDPRERADVNKAVTLARAGAPQRTITPNFDPGEITLADGRVIAGAMDNTMASGSIYVDGSGRPLPADQVKSFKPTNSARVQTMQANVPNAAGGFDKVTTDIYGNEIGRIPNVHVSEPVYPYSIMTGASGQVSMIDPRNPGAAPIPVPGAEKPVGAVTDDQRWAAGVLKRSRGLVPGAIPTQDKLNQHGAEGHTYQELIQIEAGKASRRKAGAAANAGGHGRPAAGAPAPDLTGLTPADLQAWRQRRGQPPSTPK
jgi:hypothetical protein